VQVTVSDANQSNQHHLIQQPIDADEKSHSMTLHLKVRPQADTQHLPNTCHVMPSTSQQLSAFQQCISAAILSSTHNWLHYQASTFAMPLDRPVLRAR
jgi:hypothetical protein